MHSEVLRAALDSIEDGVLVVGRDGGVLYSNARLNVLWGQPEDWTPATAEQILAELSPLVSDPVASGARFRHLREHLDERSYDLVELKGGRLMERLAAPLRIDGRTEGKIWVYRDLVDRLQFEAFGNERAAANAELAALAIDVVRELAAGRLPWAAELFLALLELGENALRELAETGGQYATADVAAAGDSFTQLAAKLSHSAPPPLRELGLVAQADASLPTTALNPAALVGGLIPVELMRARLLAATGDRPSACTVRIYGAGNSIVVADGNSLAWRPPALEFQPLVEHARESALLARFALAFGRLAGFVSAPPRTETEAFRFEAGVSDRG